MATDFDMTDSEFSPDSQFNMALAILFRIDKLFSACAVLSSQRELSAWFNILNTLLREVKYMMKENELKENSELQGKLIALDNEFQRLASRNKLSRFDKYGEFYRLLEDYETFLRKCFYDRKMLIIHKENARTAVLR